ncbi:MAG: LysR family transcriptional regulator [Pseudomonadota bacterium]
MVTRAPAPDWKDLAYFAAVARTGALARAAAEVGASTATLSRRMVALEAQMGRRLFHHGARGYALTEDGQALLDRAARMEAAALEIEDWQASASGPPRVRLSAGAWTATYLAKHIHRYWTARQAWVPEFVHCDLDLDIARREIDIGIRNRRPEQPWLAGRKLSQVTFAAYGHATVTGWIGSSADAVATPSARWLLHTHGDAIVTTANDPRLALALAQAGVGRLVLPTFVGDGTDLDRLSDIIPDLTSDRWIVAHHDARNTPHIRAALDALSEFLLSADGP